MEIIMGIVPIISIGMIILCFAIFIIMFFKAVSPKGLEKTLTKRMSMMARIQNNVLKNNEEILKETANMTANINKDAVRIMANSVKEGLAEDNLIYCNHCGSEIDEISIFCKYCGKKQ